MSSKFDFTGDDIRNIRAVRGLTQKQLAEMLHVTIRQIRNYENGARKMPRYMGELMTIKLGRMRKPAK